MSADSSYIREWRKTPAGKVSLAAQKLRDQAKRAAIKELIERHEIEYAVLFSGHLQRIKKETRDAASQAD